MNPLQSPTAEYIATMPRRCRVNNKRNSHRNNNSNNNSHTNIDDGLSEDDERLTTVVPQHQRRRRRSSARAKVDTVPFLYLASTRRGICVVCASLLILNLVALGLSSSVMVSAGAFDQEEDDSDVNSLFLTAVAALATNIMSATLQSITSVIVFLYVRKLRRDVVEEGTGGDQTFGMFDAPSAAPSPSFNKIMVAATDIASVSSSANLAESTRSASLVSTSSPRSPLVPGHVSTNLVLCSKEDDFDGDDEEAASTIAAQQRKTGRGLATLRSFEDAPSVESPNTATTDETNHNGSRCGDVPSTVIHGTLSFASVSSTNNHHHHHLPFSLSHVQGILQLRPNPENRMIMHIHACRPGHVLVANMRSLFPTTARTSVSTTATGSPTSPKFVASQGTAAMTICEILSALALRAVNSAGASISSISPQHVTLTWDTHAPTTAVSASTTTFDTMVHGVMELSEFVDLNLRGAFVAAVGCGTCTVAGVVGGVLLPSTGEEHTNLERLAALLVLSSADTPPSKRKHSMVLDADFKAFHSQSREPSVTIADFADECDIDNAAISVLYTHDAVCVLKQASSSPSRSGVIKQERGEFVAVGEVAYDPGNTTATTATTTTTMPSVVPKPKGSHNTTGGGVFSLVYIMKQPHHNNDSPLSLYFVSVDWGWQSLVQPVETAAVADGESGGDNRSVSSANSDGLGRSHSMCNNLQRFREQITGMSRTHTLHRGSIRCLQQPTATVLTKKPAGGSAHRSSLSFGTADDSWNFLDDLDDDEEELDEFGTSPLELKMSILDFNKKEFRISKADVLGRGCHGIVVRGLTPKGELVAAKVVTVGEDKERAAALVKEVETLSSLRHANVLPYISVALHGEGKQRNVYIFTQFVSGGTLDHVNKHFGPFSSDILRQYLVDVLRGLAYIHSKNMMHGDVKPQNILLDSKGRCMLSDFGSAHKFPRRGDRDENGGESNNHNNAPMPTVQGSPLFMAPEHARGQPVKESDLWSFGIMTLLLCTGSVYFPAIKKRYGEGGYDTINVTAFFYQLGRNDHMVPEIPRDGSLEAFVVQLLELTLVRDVSQRATAFDVLDRVFGECLFVAPPNNNNNNNNDNSVCGASTSSSVVVNVGVNHSCSSTNNNCNNNNNNNNNININNSLSSSVVRSPMRSPLQPPSFHNFRQKSGSINAATLSVPDDESKNN